MSARCRRRSPCNAHISEYAVAMRLIAARPLATSMTVAPTLFFPRTPRPGENSVRALNDGNVGEQTTTPSYSTLVSRSEDCRGFSS